MKDGAQGCVGALVVVALFLLVVTAGFWLDDLLRLVTRA